ncbi:MAG: M23 family metallopeptidase [Actinobacteria bacterium]|nr:M23 family metallopeptidase [Actinomycetota bacterium]
MNEYEAADGAVLENTTRSRIAAKRRAARKHRLLKRLKFVGLTTLSILIGFAGYSAVTGKNKKEDREGYGRIGQASGVTERNRPRYLVSVAGTSLKLAELVAREDLVGIGFHEAENPQARRMDPPGGYLSDETTGSVAREYKKKKGPVVFVMNTRDRGTDSKSAVDIAVRAGSAIKSPVTGVVSRIKEYYLYDQYLDYHLEITPDGYPDLRVAIIHVDKVTVSVGTRVEAGVTKIGVIRVLEGLDTQINEYLPKASDHFHIQVNPALQDGPVAQ